MKLFRPARDDRLLELLEQAGRNACRATETLRELLAEFPERSHLARDVLLREQDGDRIAHDVIHRLAQAPRRAALDSRDVYDLIRALDDIVDHAEEAADSLGLYGIEAPMEQAEVLADLLARAAVAVQRALERLRAGEEVDGTLLDIHEIEHDGDRVSRGAIASLFASGVDPMVVIRWKDIFESLERAIDSCETVAHVLEGIELKLD